MADTKQTSRGKEDREKVAVNVQDLRTLRAAVERHQYYGTDEERKQSAAAIIGFIDGWTRGLFNTNDL